MYQRKSIIGFLVLQKKERMSLFDSFKVKSYEFIKSSLEGSQSVITSSSVWRIIFTVYEAGEVN